LKEQWLHYLDVAERGCHQIPEEASGQKPSSDCKTPAARLGAAVTEVSVCTVRRTLNTEGFHARTPRRTPLLTQKHKKSRRKPYK